MEHFEPPYVMTCNSCNDLQSLTKPCSSLQSLAIPCNSLKSTLQNKQTKVLENLVETKKKSQSWKKIKWNVEAWASTTCSRLIKCSGASHCSSAAP